MNNTIQINPIGRVRAINGNFTIEIDPQYLPALTNIDGYSHLQILWWGHLYATPQYRSYFLSEKPYKTGPDKLGVFATRSPVRPNPLLLTTIQVINIDFDKGIITTPYIDAEDNTPVLDIKPYHLCDRVRDCRVPAWCAHWPQWDEESATFDWSKEFNF